MFLTAGSTGPFDSGPLAPTTVIIVPQYFFLSGSASTFGMGGGGVKTPSMPSSPVFDILKRFGFTPGLE